MSFFRDLKQTIIDLAFRKVPNIKPLLDCSQNLCQESQDNLNFLNPQSVSVPILKYLVEPQNSVILSLFSYTLIRNPFKNVFMINIGYAKGGPCFPIAHALHLNQLTPKILTPTLQSSHKVRKFGPRTKWPKRSENGLKRLSK